MLFDIMRAGFFSSLECTYFSSTRFEHAALLFAVYLLLNQTDNSRRVKYFKLFKPLEKEQLSMHLLFFDEVSSGLIQSIIIFLSHITNHLTNIFKPSNSSTIDSLGTLSTLGRLGVWSGSHWCNWSMSGWGDSNRRVRGRAHCSRSM